MVLFPAPPRRGGLNFLLTLNARNSCNLSLYHLQGTQPQSCQSADSWRQPSASDMSSLFRFSCSAIFHSVQHAEFVPGGNFCSSNCRMLVLLVFTSYQSEILSNAFSHSFGGLPNFLSQFVEGSGSCRAACLSFCKRCVRDLVCITVKTRHQKFVNIVLRVSIVCRW